MHHTTGSLIAADRTISVAVSLSVVSDGAVVRSWFGGVRWARGEDVEPTGPYRLELEDGRSGEILLLYEVVHEGQPGAAFRGVGPLE